MRSHKLILPAFRSGEIQWASYLIPGKLIKKGGITGYFFVLGTGRTMPGFMEIQRLTRGG
jgi:hypothetical protein